MRRVLFLLHLLLIVGCPFVANALSLGELQMLSQPGQPFQASIELTLDDGELIQSLAVGSVSDYTLVNIARPAIANSIVAQIKQQGGRSVIWLRGSEPMPGDDSVILLHILSNKRTYFPFFRVPRQVGVPGAVAATGAIPADKPVTPLRHDHPARSTAPPLKAAATADTADGGSQKSAAQESKYGPVRTGETLSSIARSVAKGAASTLQVEVAIWRRNPDQFVLHNMSGLKVGDMLVIPSPEEMARIDTQEAARLRAAHIAEWKKPVAQRAPSPASQPGLLLDAETRPAKADLAGTEPTPGPVHSSKSAQAPLERITAQLKTIQDILEKNEGQLDMLVKRVTVLENGQDYFKQFDQRLSVLEERIKLEDRLK
ncbi:MAG: LysM peptidoglycan-binding domain-containing protein [Magnetococcales bacterium]|nr:LysM peptidoglycan-binding domain-containing protein [Magnetococcales bacterium]